MRRVTSSALVVVFAAIGALAACSGPPAYVERYDLQGKVVSVEREKGQATIAHEQIDGFMDAMTMPFKIKEAWTLDVMEPGDTVRAVLVTGDAGTWLEEVSVSKASGVGDSPEATRAAGLPEPGAEVPDLTLVDQEGRPFRFSSLRGRAIAVTFIYTRCPLPDYCPLMTANFVDVANRLEEKPALRDRVRLLSISVDPDYDTPDVLRTYADVAVPPAARERWRFLTGTPEQVRAAAAFFGLRYYTADDQIIHTLTTAVIGPDGRVSRLFAGNEWKPGELLDALEQAAPAPSSR